MIHRWKSVPRALAAMVLTALVSVTCMLVLAPAASARVVIVPGTLQGGATTTFAVRLANEQPKMSTTRLELTFPKDMPIPTVRVAPTKGWTMKINMRPLEPSITVDGKQFDKAVDSIVWDGGKVGPKQYEQFLVTAGPLPADGQLVFTAAQTYEDGTVDRWSDPAADESAAGAPTIKIVPVPAAERPADSAAAPDTTLDQVTFTPDEVTAAAEENSFLPVVLLVGGALVIAVAGVVGYRIIGRPKPKPSQAEIDTDAEVEPEPERAGMR